MKKFLASIVANLFTLFLSLALASLIWFNAQKSEDPFTSKFMTIPVDILGQPEKSILIDPPPDGRLSVQIVFEGPTSIVTQLTAADFSATIDLSNIPFGEETTVPVTVQADIPDITLLSPQQAIDVLLEQLVTRDIPVELDLRGTVARGYKQGDPLIDPLTITISGPAANVNNIEFAQVTVWLNNNREDILDSGPPVYYDRVGNVASARDLNPSADQVDVTIPVTESAGYAEKYIDVDLVGQPAPGYRLLDINVTPLSILIQGRPTQLNQLDRVQTEPIDITGLTESFQQQVTLALPEGITQDEVEEIIVEIDIEPFYTTDTFNPTVTVQGLGETLQATVNPESVRVVLFGPLPVLESLPDEEVNVTVDLFGLITGTYSLEPDVSFPDRGIELRSIQPALVSVEITRLLTITNKLTSTLSISETTTSGLETSNTNAVASNFTSPTLPFFTFSPIPFLRRDYP